jgi:hypothetical protein
MAGEDIPLIGIPKINPNNFNTYVQNYMDKFVPIPFSDMNLIGEDYSGEIINNTPYAQLVSIFMTGSEGTVYTMELMNELETSYYTVTLPAGLTTQILPPGYKCGIIGAS